MGAGLVHGTGAEQQQVEVGLQRGALTLTKADPGMLKTVDPPDAQLSRRMR